MCASVVGGGWEDGCGEGGGCVRSGSGSDKVRVRNAFGIGLLVFMRLQVPFSASLHVASFVTVSSKGHR